MTNTCAHQYGVPFGLAVLVVLVCTKDVRFWCVSNDIDGFRCIDAVEGLALIFDEAASEFECWDL